MRVRFAPCDSPPPTTVCLLCRYRRVRRKAGTARTMHQCVQCGGHECAHCTRHTPTCEYCTAVYRQLGTYPPA
jgi:hypothetical protein